MARTKISIYVCVNRYYASKIVVTMKITLMDDCKMIFHNRHSRVRMKVTQVVSADVEHVVA